MRVGMGLDEGLQRLNIHVDKLYEPAGLPGLLLA